MEQLLKELLERLESIGAEHEELFDTEVRQSISNAIMDGFVRGRQGFLLPIDFGMDTPAGNLAVRSALEEYSSAANKKAVDLQLLHFHDRLAALQNDHVRTAEGNDYEEFLGHSPPEFFDMLGNVIRTD